MTNEQLKRLETELWGAADNLRANSKLTAAEYKDPVLGLILLRYAQNKFEEAKKQIEKELPINPRTNQKREVTKNDFLGVGAMYLQEKSQFDYLVNLPESQDIAETVNNAMRLIETDYKDLEGILPKNYQEFDADLLRSLIRVFNKDAVKNIGGDVFGRIYEFFLMKFSMSGAGAQEGGEFFTPPSLVQMIVNFIEPDHGIIHDPACGSGGMFVQTGHFIQSHTNKQVNEAITVYGTELKSNNVKLAKMNLAIHGIEGKIFENNSFYSNPHELTGKCDFVMANPPFNVKKVDKNKDYVKEDPRLPYGLPNADNGNYMWIQYFYSYLNQKGRAGFVMPSSATDARHSEKLIREKLFETGHIDIIISIGNNFFYTRSLPCHLWFFDKNKNPDNTNKVLMIDARNTYRKVSSTINDFSPEQLEGLTTIVKAYRGENVDFSKNDWLKETFPNGTYEDIKGLCKIVDKSEIIYNEYSLTPGRYVGYTFEIDKDFNFQEELDTKKESIQLLHNNVSNLWKSSLEKFSKHKTLSDYDNTNLEELIDFHIGGGWGNEVEYNEFTEPAYVIRGTDFDSVELGEIKNVPFRYHKKSNLKSRKLKVGDIIFEVSGGSSNSGVAKSLLITKEILETFNKDVMCASFCKLIRLEDIQLAPYTYLYLRFLRDIKATEIFEIRSASNIINYNFTAFLKFQDIIKPNNGFIDEFNLFVVPIMSSIIKLGIQTTELKQTLEIIFPGLMKDVK